MINSTLYTSPIGKILLASKDNKLIGVWFEGQKHFLSGIDEELTENEDETLPSQKKLNEKSMNKISKSFSFNSNIIIVESSSENSEESDYNNLIEKEIEKINTLNKE